MYCFYCIPSTPPSVQHLQEHSLQRFYGSMRGIAPEMNIPGLNLVVTTPSWSTQDRLQRVIDRYVSVNPASNAAPPHYLDPEEGYTRSEDCWQYVSYQGAEHTSKQSCGQHAVIKSTELAPASRDTEAVLSSGVSLPSTACIGSCCSAVLLSSAECTACCCFAHREKR